VQGLKHRWCIHIIPTILGILTPSYEITISPRECIVILQKVHCNPSWERAVDFLADGGNSGPVSVLASSGVLTLVPCTASSTFSTWVHSNTMQSIVMEYLQFCLVCTVQFRPLLLTVYKCFQSLMSRYIFSKILYYALEVYYMLMSCNHTKSTYLVQPILESQNSLYCTSSVQYY
jgi:hypothetical protein